MPNNTPLAIDNFEFEKLRAKPFKSKKSAVFNYFAIPFDYDGGDPLIKIEGNFRVFRHVNAGRVNYSMANSINDKNKEFFSELGHKIAKLAYENRGYTPKLKSLKPSDLELIKTSRNGKYKNVYVRIYTSSSRRVMCEMSELQESMRRKLKIGDLVDETFM